MTDAPFDPRKAITELVNSQVEGPGRKLSFFDKCAAFAAIYNGTKHAHVALAFGISRIAVSQLGGCLARDPRPYSVELVAEKHRVPVLGPDDKPAGGFKFVSTGAMLEKRTSRDMNENRSPVRKRRYQDVAQEFERLGEEAFFQRYYTEAIHLRLMKVKHSVDEEASRRARKGPDPEPDGLPDFVDLPDGQERTFIKWLDEPRPPGPAGWYIVGPHRDMGSQWETDVQWPFKTQAAARAAVWTSNGYSAPE